MVKNEDRTFLSVTEAGQRLGVSRKTAYNFVNDGVLPVIWLRGVRRVPVGALEQWVADRDREALAAVRGGPG